MNNSKELENSIKRLPQLFCKVENIEKLLNNNIANNSVISIDSITSDINGKLIITFTDTTGQHTIETDSLQKFIIKYNVLNYNELLTTTPNLYDYAYVREEQGIQWLPGSLGGTYYTSGLYMWDGVTWINDDKYIINEINNILNAISLLPTAFAPVNAEQNVQADWNESDTNSDAFIKNKPTIPSVLGLATTIYVNSKDNLKVDKIQLNGGLEGQILTKNTNIDQDYSWKTFGGLNIVTTNPTTPSLGQQWILEENTVGQLQFNSFMTPIVNNSKTYYLCMYNGTTIKKIILN